MSVADNTISPQTLLDARVRLPTGVVYRSFVKETVILNLETGRYHGLNPTGGRMLAVLDEVKSVRESAAQVAREYQQPVAEIQSDICDFIAGLVERGLLEVTSA